MHTTGESEGNYVYTLLTAAPADWATNFTSYFKSNSDFWEVWPDKYDKTLSISLSAEGKKELAKVILDLTKDE